MSPGKAIHSSAADTRELGAGCKHWLHSPSEREAYSLFAAETPVKAPCVSQLGSHKSISFFSCIIMEGEMKGNTDP